MILLKELQLNNFLSHKDTTIKFSKGDKILIDGASGAGKSSVFDAIIWALYGQGRASNRNLIRVGAKNASVSLKMGGAKRVTTITRTVSQKGKHTLTVFTKEGKNKQEALALAGVKETQNWIDKELIGASYLLFINSVAYMQGNTDSFVVQTAQKRKELLLEIIKAESYKKHHKNARNVVSELLEKKSGLLGRLSELNARKGHVSANTGDPQECIEVISQAKTLEKIKTQIEVLKKKDYELSLAIRSLTFINNDLDHAEEKIDVLLQEIKELETETSVKKKNELEKKLEGFADPFEEISKAESIQKEREELMKNKPNIPDFTIEMERTKKALERLESQPECPSDDCPYFKDVPRQIEEFKDEIARYKKEISVQQLKLVDWDIKLSALKVVDTTEALKRIKTLESLAALKEKEKQLPIKRKELEVVFNKRQDIEWEIIKQKKLTDPKILEETKKELAEHEEGLITLNNDITQAKARLEAINKSEEEIKEIDDKIKLLETKTIPKLDIDIKRVGLIKAAFAPRGGIETMVIDYLIPKLEDRINEILSKLSDFRVRLDTQKTGVDKETTIEGLFITILNEKNEEMPFEAYSGGEKLKILVAISESLATLQKVSFRLFDETFLGLDENSTESFAEVLQGLQENFDQVLCISHLLQIKELFDQKINIVKNNNISNVR